MKDKETPIDGLQKMYKVSQKSICTTKQSSSLRIAQKTRLRKSDLGVSTAVETLSSHDMEVMLVARFHPDAAPTVEVVTNIDGTRKSK